jgi:short-subunit dehydrogenase
LATWDRSHRLPGVPSRPRIELADATVLLTGASGGIGHAIAQALAGRGAKLILTGRRGPQLEKLAGPLGARTLVADLAVRADVDRLAEEAVAAGAEVLVANAALPASGLLTELSATEVERMLDVNLRAPIVLAQALAPSMIARGRGHLVFVSSLSGKVASPASPMYSATKFGLRGFALGLRQDLLGHGVGVSVVAPGFIREAGMFADTGLELPRGTGTRSPADVAAAVLRAIDRNPAELDVAPLSLRIGAAIASVVPGPAARASSLLGSQRLANAMAERQSDKR